MGYSDYATIAEIGKKLTTQEVLEDEDFATMIIKSTMDGIYAYDLNRRVTLWNPAMERLTGYPKENVLGRDMFEIFPFFAELKLEHMVTDPLKGMTVYNEDMPFRVPHKSGYSSRKASPIYDERGKVVGGLCIVRETTDAKQALEDLRVKTRTEERLRLLSEAGLLLSSTLDYETVLSRIIDLTTKHFRAWSKLLIQDEAGKISLYTGHIDPVLAEKCADLERKFPTPEDLNEGPYWVLRNGGYHFVPQFTEEGIRGYAKTPDHYDTLMATRLKSYICVPLQARGKIFGTLSVLSSERNYTEDDLRFAQDLSRWVGIALENARLYDLATKK